MLVTLFDLPVVVHTGAVVPRKVLLQAVIEQFDSPSLSPFSREQSTGKKLDHCSVEIFGQRCNLWS